MISGSPPGSACRSLYALLPERWWRARWQRILLAAALLLTAYGAFFTAAAEWFFFEEFDSRFNFVAVDYLIYPTEVVTNIWESYPTGKVLAGLALLVGGLAFALRRPFRSAWRRPASLTRRLSWPAVHAGALALLTLVASPRSLVDASPDRLVRELTSNGYLAFGEALLGLDAPYAGFYATRPPEQVHARLETLLDQPATPGFHLPAGSSARWIHAAGKPRPWNVVLLLEESLGSEFIGALQPGGATSLTPEFDALTRDGTLFTEAYSTGNRTIRAIEATTASLPPLPGAPVVHRRGAEGLFTLPAVLGKHGYQTLFVYGGRAIFDGMGPYLEANGIQRVVQQSDFPRHEFKTAWGVSDQAILDRALAEMEQMDRSGQPFFTMVLSVSNHRPYTFPTGTVERREGLTRRQNVVRYADWSIGRFFRAARQREFYDHTLFVVMGDHGARVYGAASIPLASYQVPILMIAPGALPAGQRLDTLTSSLDVPPTILGFLGISYPSRFFGHDLFRIRPEDGRALMGHNSEIALMRGDRIAVLGLRESADVYRVDRRTGEFTALDPHDAASIDLVEDAISYFQSADRMVRENGYRLEIPELGFGAATPQLAAIARPAAEPAPH
ncbi:MAG: LTA synthase family protein [Thermoanaerobaculia bacterium]